MLIAEPAARHLCGLSRYVHKSLVTAAPNDNREAYLRDILDAVAAEKVSLIVPVSEEIMHVSQLADRLPGDVRLFCPTHDELMPLHDKYVFNQSSRSFGLAVPETHLLGTPKAEKLALEHDVIVKPALTCSGRGLERLPAGSALPEGRPGLDILVQKVLSGPHSSTFSVAHQGRVIGTVVYRPEISSGTVAVAFRLLREAPAETEWVEEFVGKTGHSGFISFDFIAGEDGRPTAIECNPRVTSGIHFVDPRSLSQAILEPETCQHLRLKNHTVMHQLWPTLTEVQGSMFRPGRGYFHKMGTLLRTKEVNFEWLDPLPVLLQPYAAWDIMRRALARGESFGEASTHDIGWFDDPG